MSENEKSDISFREWAIKRQEYVKKAVVRADAFKDVSEGKAMSAKDGFAWITMILSELENLYSALIVMDGNQEDLHENAVYLKDVVKESLGLPDSQMTKEQVNERAKEIGKFFQGIIDRQNELERQR